MTFGFGRRRDPVALDPLKDICGIPSLERLDGAVVHLPHGGRDFVEKPTVVGDDEESADVLGPPVLQMPRKPGNPFDVEVVGRLVEHENVPLADQEGRESEAAPLAARERAHPRLPVEVSDEARYDVADFGVGGPFVLGGLSHERIAHCRVCVEGVVLLKHADAQASAPGHKAFGRVERSRKDSQKRRFSAAVSADDADSVPFPDSEGCRIEDDAVGVLQPDRLRSEKMSHHFASATQAPAAGPFARTARRFGNSIAARIARRSACAASEARRATVGPEPERMAVAPKRLARSTTSSRSGRSEKAGA